MLNARKMSKGRVLSIQSHVAFGYVGGKAAVLEQQGFRFDMGPTILTVPAVLERVFAEAGVRMRDRLELIPLDPQWRCFFDDGGVLELFADADRMKEALATLPQPTLGFCRSGTRAAALWALAEADRADPATIVDQAKAAGYDLADLTPALKRRSERADQ